MATLPTTLSGKESNFVWPAALLAIPHHQLLRLHNSTYILSSNSDLFSFIYIFFSSRNFCPTTCKLSGSSSMSSQPYPHQPLNHVIQRGIEIFGSNKLSGSLFQFQRSSSQSGFRLTDLVVVGGLGWAGWAAATKRGDGYNTTITDLYGIEWVGTVFNMLWWNSQITGRSWIWYCVIFGCIVTSGFEAIDFTISRILTTTTPWLSVIDFV